MSDVAIRPARSADLAALSALYNHYVRETPITFDVEPYEVEARRPWLEGFATTGPYRLLVAEREAELLGYAGITLPNPASIRLHQRFGFRPIGVFHEVGRKLGRYWDVAWYEKDLSTA